MIEIRRGDELGESSRRRITEVLVRGFAEDFAYFSKDPRVLTDAFAHMLVLERFYVAVVDGEPAAVASVTEGEQECFAPRGAPSGTRWVVSTARSATGSSGASSSAQTTVRGTASRRSGSSRRRRSTRAGGGHRAHASPDGAAVRRARAARHQGHQRPALGLYRKLGFTETGRRPVRFARRAGFSAYVTMSHARDVAS